MRNFLLVLCAILLAEISVCPTAIAQIVNVPASPEANSIPVYPDDNVGSAEDEVWTKIGPMTVIRNVTRPTLRPILPPRDKATGAAVILAPGGGMIFLAMPEREIADYLVGQGIAVFVLKYRVLPTPNEIPQLRGVFSQLREQSKDGEIILSNPEGNADAQAAVALVRSQAEKWGIDPGKVGLLGFSSGAQVSRAAALSDTPVGRPDFIGLIYGAMDHVDVPATAPPMFAAIAMDDATVPSAGFPVVESWRNAGRPVELHAYQTGGHGFAQGDATATHRRYLKQFTAWLAMQGFLSER